MLARRARLATAFLTIVLALAGDLAGAAELRVGPGETYTTIGAAVEAAAASGDTILVAAGTYVEQVTVVGGDLTIRGDGPGLTVIQAPETLTSLFEHAGPHFGVIGVATAEVVIESLTIDGFGRGNDHERFHGLLLHNAAASLADVAVTGVRNTPRDAADHGVGIGFYGDDGLAHAVALTDVTIADFQRVGVAALARTGSSLDFACHDGEIVGAGALADLAQIGMQLTGPSVTASIDGSRLRDLAASGTDLNAVGLLMQDAAGTVTGNDLTGCQTGIVLSSAPMTVHQNVITVVRPGATGAGMMVDNVDPEFGGLVPRRGAVTGYAPEWRDGRSDRATLTMIITDNEVALDPALDDDAGTFGLWAENRAATDDLDLIASGNTFTGVATAIGLRDTAPSDGAWIAVDCNGNTFNTVTTGLDTDLALTVAAENCWWGALDGPSGDGPGSGVGLLGNADVTPFRTDVVNLVAEPAQLTLTEQDTTGTVVFDYIGGASGRIYGYSIDVVWDPALVSAGAADFARPADGPFAEADYFLTQDIADGHVRVDLALGSSVAGVYQAPLFAASFTLVPGAAHAAEAAITPTVLEIRDNANQALAGLVPTPGTIIVDSTPVLVDVNVTDTTIGSDLWTRDGHDLTITATLLETSLDSLRCDLTAFGGPVLELADATADADQYTWTFSGTTDLGDGEVVAVVTAVDVFATSAAASGVITADNTPPAGLAALTVAPGHQRVHLAWEAPAADGGSPPAGVEFRYTTWGNYPAYAGELPGAPTSLAEGDDPGLGVVAETEADWAVSARDVYVIAGFVHDLVGNVSGAGASGAATNYWLGDHDGDGLVDVLADLTALGDSYGRAQGQDGYDAVCDVGPTFDFSPRGVPNPQADGYQVQFEDLMVTALNHDEVGPEGKRLGDVPSLQWERQDEHTWRLLLAEPCDGLKGLNLRGVLPAGTTCTVDAGDLLPSQSAPVFVRNIAAHGLDAGVAIMGAGATISGAGEVLRVVTSRPLTHWPVTLSARDTGNHELLAEITAVALPAVHGLAQNAPNPFNPQTVIRFELPRAERVQLAIYAVDGKLVRTLVDADRPAGRHAVTWSGRDDDGRPVATGTYFYALQAGDFRQVRKMTLMK